MRPPRDVDRPARPAAAVALTCGEVSRRARLSARCECAVPSLANAFVAARLTRAAAADGASLIVLPEKWTAMGPDEELRGAAEQRLEHADEQ